MKTETDLKIFKTPNIENFKVSYYKSIAFLLQKFSLKAGEKKLVKVYKQVKESHRVKNSIKQIGIDLNIFATPNIDNLKTLFYQSNGFVFKQNGWEAETSPKLRSFWQFNGVYKLKRRQSENDLNIFATPSIEYFKTLYYKSLGYAFDNKIWKVMKLRHVKSLWKFKVAYKTKKSLKYLGNELMIFTKPNLEMCKSLYYKSIGRVFENNNWEPETTSET